MTNLFFSNSRLIMEGIFAISALISFILIYKLNVIKLYTGWGLLVVGLWIEFIDEFTVKTGFITIYLDGILISIGLIITTYGFYSLIKKDEKLKNKLQATNYDYETILKNTQDAIFLIDVEEDKFIYRRVNSAFKKRTGFSADEVEGKTPIEVMGLDQGQKLKDNYKKCITKREAINYNQELSLPQGQKVWHTRLSPVFNQKMEIEKIVGSSRDITKLKKMSQNLAESQNKYKQLFNEAPIGLVKYDLDGNIINLNYKLVKMLGSPGKEVSLDFNVFELTGLEKLQKDVKLAIKKENIITNEFYYKSQWGKELWVEYHINPLTKYGIDEIIVSFNDITDKKEAEEEMIYLSFHDQLTDLYNRRYFENELHRLNNSRSLPISIIIADLDDLKDVNDNYGHDKGDKYIKIASQILEDSIRSEDIAARIGGDEFALILPKTNKEAAEKLCKRIHNKCQKYNKKKGLNPSISLSVGFAVKENKNTDINEIYKEADHNMYNMKNSNKY